MLLETYPFVQVIESLCIGLYWYVKHQWEPTAHFSWSLRKRHFAWSTACTAAKHACHVGPLHVSSISRTSFCRGIPCSRSSVQSSPSSVARGADPHVLRTRLGGAFAKALGDAVRACYPGFRALNIAPWTTHPRVGTGGDWPGKRRGAPETVG